MDTPLPFDPDPDLTILRVQLGGLLQLVLLVAPVGSVWALWCIGGQWADAVIGRA